MVGGHVLDTIDQGEEGLWIKVLIEHTRSVAFFLPRTDKTRSMSPRDYVRLENGVAYWSPRDTRQEYNVGAFRNFVTLTGNPVHSRTVSACG
jgi:hypothetical protein